MSEYLRLTEDREPDGGDERNVGSFVGSITAVLSSIITLIYHQRQLTARDVRHKLRLRFQLRDSWNWTYQTVNVWTFSSLDFD